MGVLNTVPRQGLGTRPSSAHEASPAEPAAPPHFLQTSAQMSLPEKDLAATQSKIASHSASPSPSPVLLFFKAPV